MRRLFIMRKDLKMSTGKLISQVSHCAEAYWTNKLREAKVVGGVYQVEVDPEIMEGYVCDRFVKTICQARNKNNLLKAVEMAKELGLEEGKDFGLIYDACLTELTPEEEDGTTLTGIWFKPLPDEIAWKISRKYHLYI